MLTLESHLIESLYFNFVQSIFAQFCKKIKFLQPEVGWETATAANIGCDPFQNVSVQDAKARKPQNKSLLRIA